MGTALAPVSKGIQQDDSTYDARGRDWLVFLVKATRIELVAFRAHWSAVVAFRLARTTQLTGSDRTFPWEYCTDIQ